MLRVSKRKRNGEAYTRSAKQEKERAKALGGRVTKASGATRYDKADVAIKNAARVELKTTKRKSFSLTRDMVDKVENAASGGELPFIEVEFLDDKGLPCKSIAVIPSWALDVMMERMASDIK